MAVQSRSYLVNFYAVHCIALHIETRISMKGVNMSITSLIMIGFNSSFATSHRLPMQRGMPNFIAISWKTCKIMYVQSRSNLVNFYAEHCIAIHIHVDRYRWKVWIWVYLLWLWWDSIDFLQHRIDCTCKEACQISLQYLEKHGR